MKILAIDTSSKNCSVAIVEVNSNSFNVLAFKNSDDERTHSQKLMPIVEQIFTDNSLTLDNIDLLTCCIGPGSFTGIRIGVATVKAFCDSKNIPAVPVDSLESLAYNVSDTGYIIPIIDAKNENVYASMLHFDGSTYKNIIDNFADNINSCLNRIKSNINSNESIAFVGNRSNII